MWSHTIKSSAPKSTDPPAERSSRTANNLKQKDDAVKELEEDMTKGFDADGFSKMSKVHASKKPLTVAKAPSFGRTTSRIGQMTTGGADPPPTNSPNKSTRPVKPTQGSRAGTPARVPRTATPTQSTSRTSRTGSPLQKRPPTTSPKVTAPGRRVTNTSTRNGVRSPDLDLHKPDEPGETSVNNTHSKDEDDVDGVSRTNDVPGQQKFEELNRTIAVKDGEIRDLQAEIQDIRTTKDAEIQGLGDQIKSSRTTNEHKEEETKASFLAQIAALESEVDDARKNISDLEVTHRTTQEEYSKIKRLKDEDIPKLTEAAHGQRGEQEAKESVLSLKGEFQGLQIKHKRELDEAAAAASVNLEAIRAEHDELLQSRDQEIKEMSDLVQELQEKVEKAHQADKDELEEAKTRHAIELRDKVEQHEQELGDANTKHEQVLRDDALQHEQGLRDVTTRHEELQQRVPRLEQELQSATVKHVQELNDAKEEHQTTLHDAIQRHEQESRDTASKYQQELEDLMLTHHEEIKTARARDEQSSGDSAARYQQGIEALIAKHKEDLETANTRQEQALGDAAAKYQQESQALEATHLEVLRTATTRNEQEIGSTASKNQQAVEAMRVKQREELASANTQIEELRIVTQKHQQELGDLVTSHEQELERITHEREQELRGVTIKYDQELEEAMAKYKELEDRSLQEEQNSREAAQKIQEETVRLRNQLETAAGNVASLETTLKALDHQREDSAREAASKYEQELRTATLKYEEELQSLRQIYATAVEEITTLRRALEDVEQKQSEAVEEELQSLRTIYATAVEEITALRRKVETVDQKRSEAVDEAASLKASLNDLDLKRSEAVGQVTSLEGIMKDGEFERREAAVELALLRDKMELADRRFGQDQQAVSDLQRQVRGLQAQIAEISTDTSLDRNEAVVDATLLKDKLELADLEIHLHKGKTSALQNEIERLQTQLAEQSTDTVLDRNEAVVDVALLKDKLELADIQIRQAKGTVSDLQEEIEGLKTQITDSTVGMDLEQNEAAVETALLKNALELANLESHQDKATITTLQKQIEGFQAQAADAPKTRSYPQHQLRGELSMLGRHQAAQMTDLDALKADMAAESELREQEWKKRADVWDRFASELQGMKTQLAGTVGGGFNVGN